MIVIISILSLIYLVYYLLKSRYEYWEKRGVPGPKPTLFVGNMGESFTLKKSPFDIYTEIYNKFAQYPFVGIFKATIPTLIIRDPELIKDITVKSFRHFHANELEADKKIDPLLGRNPFFLNGEEWKTTRSQLAPGFTSGKMKLIYQDLENTSEALVEFIDKQQNASNGEGCDAKKVCARFTLDNVARCAFGIEAGAFTEEKSDFREVAEGFFKMGLLQNILFTLTVFFPSLMTILRLKFVPKDIEETLLNIIKQSVKYREDNGIVRNDFLHILNQLKKNTPGFTDIDLTAQATMFFTDGYETTAGVMTFVLYEISRHSQIQTKLRQELTEAFQANNDKIPFEVLQTLPLLDAVINETLRFHPPLFSLVKKCTKPYTYIPKEGDRITKPVVIEEGTSIAIPLGGLHKDPKYFDDPDTFSPDRFIGDNKKNINKYVYMPFGTGPRTCLGQRFGLLQIKIAVAHIIKNFELSLNKKTKQPLEYDPSSILVAAKGGIWIDFKNIQ